MASGYLDLGRGTDRSQTTRLGKMLSSKRDRRFGSLKLTRGELRQGVATYVPREDD